MTLSPIIYPHIFVNLLHRIKSASLHAAAAASLHHRQQSQQTVPERTRQPTSHQTIRRVRGQILTRGFAGCRLVGRLRSGLGWEGGPGSDCGQRPLVRGRWVRLLDAAAPPKAAEMAQRDCGANGVGSGAWLPPPRIGVLSERGEVLGRPVGAEVLRALQKAQNPKNTIQIACKFLRELPGMYTLLFHLLGETILTVQNYVLCNTVHILDNHSHFFHQKSIDTTTKAQISQKNNKLCKKNVNFQDV